jgi:uroporphyrinogen decarboxylase
MNDRHWDQLLQILAGESLDPLPVGFLVDGPWVAASHGVSLMEYLASDESWLQANLQAHQRYPHVLWLPGFWAEYGMISNPPSFGCKCVWPDTGFPTCNPVLRGYDDISQLAPPDVRTDGLLPLIIQRLEQTRSRIEQAGHRIRFATSHGPLTIGSYLLGHTEFFLGMREQPQAIQDLLSIVTEFVTDWLVYQRERFPTIDGVLVLEDLMGFVGERDFQAFALPYMQKIFATLDVQVRFLHNDAAGLITARHLAAMNVNLFNFSFEHDFNEIRRLAGNEVTLLGNIPPRDVLALGSPAQVRQRAAALRAALSDPRRVILSGGGFTPGDFTADKIHAFCAACGHAPEGSN